MEPSGNRKPFSTSDFQNFMRDYHRVKQNESTSRRFNINNIDVLPFYVLHSIKSLSNALVR